MKKIHWGILSTARINWRLIPEMHASKRCDILAVASRELERAREYAREWKIPHAYGSYRDLLNDPEIDIVYNSLPNDLHTEWTIRALESGKHVLCEKPLCLTIEEFEKISSTSRRTGKVVMEAYMYVHHPQTAMFKQIIDEGRLGRIVALQSEFTAMFSRPMDNYRMDPKRGGGALWDIGVYPVSFFRLMDRSAVMDVAGEAKWNKGIDMSFWGRLDFASGVTGQFVVSFESEYSTRTAVMGTEGRLDITHPYNAASECRAWITRDATKEELQLPKVSLYAGEIENMNDVVLGTEMPAFTLEDSRRVLEVILALRKAVSES